MTWTTISCKFKLFSFEEQLMIWLARALRYNSSRARKTTVSWPKPLRQRPSTSSPNFTISQKPWLIPRVLKGLPEAAHIRRRCGACKHFILNALHLKIDFYSCSVSWIWFDLSFFQVLFRFPSCGVLSGEVMVALTEHPVVDVVLVVEDTSLGSTNIQVEKAWVQP